VRAPDLPGHGATPPPVGGSYELADAVFAVLPSLAGGSPGSEPVVVGVGTNGWSASVLALGGRAAALVLVDGLGGPWVDAPMAIAAGRDWLRAIADDPAALAPAPAEGPDPRLRHGVPPHGSRSLAERAAGATAVPALLVETPASAVAAADVAALAGCFGGGAVVTGLADGTADAVAAAVVAWAAGASTS
jgi:pimeloyl-ACP methyl ester carboxylesterase